MLIFKNKMKKYKIFTTVRVGWTYEVKAEDEKEAEEKWGTRRIYESEI